MLSNIILRGLARRKLVQSRTSSSASESSVSAHISLNDYQKASDSTLEDLSERLESILEKRYDDGADVSLSSGVLTVTVDSENIFVINKQTPNRQIWLSSPISGPKRFEYISGSWQEKHTRIDLRKLLSDELSELLKDKVEC